MLSSRACSCSPCSASSSVTKRLGSDRSEGLFASRPRYCLSSGRSCASLLNLCCKVVDVLRSNLGTMVTNCMPFFRRLISSLSSSLEKLRLKCHDGVCPRSVRSLPAAISARAVARISPGPVSSGYCLSSLAHMVCNTGRFLPLKYGSISVNVRPWLRSRMRRLLSSLKRSTPGFL